MERGQFDALARLIAAQRSRRSAIAALLGATVLGPLSSSVAARRKGNDRNRRDGGKSSSKRKSKDKPRGNSKSKRRTAKDRKARTTAAEATRCCSTGNCTPGKGKNLQKCCYQGQNLTGKIFQGANLGSANFAGATLTSANLQGANAGQACFVDAVLTGVKTNASTNLGGAIYCRTQTDRGENNSGCDKGTPCCPTCDAANPCGADEVCCSGRCLAGNCCDNNDRSTCGDGAFCCGNTCVTGDCCAAADCPNEICQRRACADNSCVYTPVFGEQGPRCQTICCEDEQDEPVCCPNGATTCDAQRLCCIPPTKDVTCGVGTAAPKCGDVTDACGLMVDCGLCAQRTCEDGTCTGDNHTCEYVPVIGEAGTGCQTICCEDTQGNPACCATGTTICQTNGVCGCARKEDCASDQVCCGEQCVSGVCCEDQDCPQEICQSRDCLDHTCDYTPVFGTTGPECQTVCCRDASGNPDCCDAGTTRCAVSGRCTCTGNDDCDGGDICCNGRCVVPVWNHQTNFGSFGFDPNEFLHPEGVAVTPNGQTAWVADSILEWVSVWTKSGATWTHAGTFGEGPLNNPSGVEVANDGNTAWVADTLNDRVSVWARSGSSWANTTNFGSEGAGTNQFVFPTDVAVSADGNTAWVADGGNHRISIWTKSGSTWSPQTAFGSEGSGPNQFNFPVGVAIAADEQTVWVAEGDGHRVSVWGKSGSMWSNLTTFGPGVAGGVAGVDVTSDGRTVFVTEPFRNVVSVWVRSGSNWTRKLTFGSGVSGGMAEAGIAVSSGADTAWVPNPGGSVVEVWARACPAT